MLQSGPRRAERPAGTYTRRGGTQLAYSKSMT